MVEGGSRVKLALRQEWTLAEGVVLQPHVRRLLKNPKKEKFHLESKQQTSQSNTQNIEGEEKDRLTLFHLSLHTLGQAWAPLVPREGAEDGNAPARLSARSRSFYCWPLGVWRLHHQVCCKSSVAKFLPVTGQRPGRHRRLLESGACPACKLSNPGDSSAFSCPRSPLPSTACRQPPNHSQCFVACPQHESIIFPLDFPPPSARARRVSEMPCENLRNCRR